MAKLMAEHCGTNDSVVINGDFTGQFGRIAYDKTTSEDAIVGHMHILHQQVIATDSSGSFGGCTTGDGYILPDAVVVTKHAGGLFSLEFQVLRLGRDACTGKYLIVVSNAGTCMDSNTILKYIIITKYCVFVNVTERAYDVVVAELGLRMNKG